MHSHSTWRERVTPPELDGPPVHLHHARQHPVPVVVHRLGRARQAGRPRARGQGGRAHAVGRRGRGERGTLAAAARGVVT